MAITLQLIEEAKKVYEKMEEDKYEDLIQGLDYTNERAIIKQTCETFTRLLLSITPYKAKEFVEKNCAKVKSRILRNVDEKIIEYLTGGQEDNK